jgi:hypothetical protein
MERYSSTLCPIATVYQDMIVVKLPVQGAWHPCHTVPVSPILYISDSELP